MDKSTKFIRKDKVNLITGLQQEIQTWGNREESEKTETRKEKLEKNTK